MCRVERGYCTVIDQNLSASVDDLELEAINHHE